MTHLTQLTYLVATALFILSLKWMSHPSSARRGVFAGVLAMLSAVVGTLLHHDIVSFKWIAVAVVCGTIAGVPLSMVALTAVPQRTALSHAFGGLAAGLVGTAEYYLWFSDADHVPSKFAMTALVFEIIFGFLTCTGSLFAAAKLQEISWVPQRPVTYRFQNITNLGLLAVALCLGVLLIVWPEQSWSPWVFPFIIALALAFGILFIIPIGGADMPTVISILNSYAGLSAVAMGFVLDNKLLITAGALDGSSGLILSIIMCRAMNRSFTNVLFGAFGKAQAAAAKGDQKSAKAATAEDAALILQNASKVVIVPGYGMAVAQAQHRVRDLYEQLSKKGIDVRFAIHPVAGRMPGHMNVLLAEAEVPYDQVFEMEDINGEFGEADVALILGANDVVNPAAKDPKSAIAGMPILEAYKAKQVIVNKRSMASGYAGLDNELFYMPKTMMVFGDAKKVVEEMGKAVG